MTGRDRDADWVRKRVDPAPMQRREGGEGTARETTVRVADGEMRRVVEVGMSSELIESMSGSGSAAAAMDE